MARLTIAFNPADKSQFPVKMIMKNPLLSTKLAAPSAFQAAALLDELVAAHPTTVIPLNQKMPFTDLMLHPEKVEAVLRIVEYENPVNGKKPARNKMAAGRSVKRNI